MGNKKPEFGSSCRNGSDTGLRNHPPHTHTHTKPISISACLTFSLPLSERRERRGKERGVEGRSWEKLSFGLQVRCIFHLWDAVASGSQQYIEFWVFFSSSIIIDHGKTKSQGFELSDHLHVRERTVRMVQ